MIFACIYNCGGFDVPLFESYDHDECETFIDTHQTLSDKPLQVVPLDQVRSLVIS